MTDPVALLREDGDPLIIDGATSVGEAYSGTVTEHALPDRSYATDGVTERPTVVTIEAVVSPSPAITGLTVGQARIAEVREWLRRVKRTATILDVQRPGRDLLVGYVIESYNLDRGRLDAERLSLTLRELRIASTEAVTLEARSVRSAEPTDGAKDGLDPEDDKGKRPTSDTPTSALVAGVQAAAAAAGFGGGVNDGEGD